MKSSHQLRRMLRLVPYLQRHPGISVSEAAAHFDITEKQLLADLSVLQFCGLPEGYYDDLFDIDLEATREDGLIYFDNAAVLSRPLRMTTAEATSLILALESVLELTGGMPAAASALEKLKLASGAAPQSISVEILRGETDHHCRLVEAIESRQAVRLDYTGVSARSHPVVEPARLRIVDGFTYLDAWSRSRDAWRSYRLDRIVAAEVLEERFEPRPGIEELDRAWFSDASDSVEITVADSAAWVAEYYPHSALERDADRLRLRLPLGSTAWLVGLILRLGEDVLEVSDPRLRQGAARNAELALSHYGVVLGEPDDAR